MELRVPMSKVDLSHLVGKKVGSSTLLKEVARGGMAAVFAAYQSSLKRQIAVKILPKNIITPQTAQLFQQEAELAAILSHPNIIPVYEVGDEGDFLFLAMQLVKGQPLSYFIKRAKKNVIPSKRTLPLKTVFKVTLNVLDAMDYAHSQKIIHRDIKPQNILIEGHSKRPLIVDFGVAQASKSIDGTSDMILGSPMYMPPEQILYPEVDGRADVYAIAIMMLEMMSFEPLFPGITKARDLIKMKVEREDKLFDKKPSEMNPLLNEEMDKIFSKAITYSADDRYSSCREFLIQLEQWQDEYLR